MAAGGDQVPATAFFSEPRTPAS